MRIENGTQTGREIRRRTGRGIRAEVSERGMWLRMKRKKRKTREGRGFYEVDAALVCDELADFLINLTQDYLPLLLSSFSFALHSASPFFFFIIYRESLGMPISPMFS